MTQYMVTGYRLNPATVPQEVIEKAAMKEIREMRERIRKQEAGKCAAEIERARMVEGSRNRLLAEKQRQLNAAKKRGAFRAFTDRIDTAWATGWGILFVIWDAIIDFGLRYGLWVYEPYDE